MNRRRFLAAAGALAASCGGGGGPSSSGTITPAPAIRADLGYGYYYGQSTWTLEVAPHSNLWWAAYNNDPNAQNAGLIQAKGLFRDVVLDMSGAIGLVDPEGDIRRFFDRIAKPGLLAQVTCLYPRDEPNNPRAFGGALTDSQVGQQNDLLRKVATDYGLPSSIDIGAFYSVGDPDRPGFTSFTRMGLSAYDYGSRQGGLLDAWESLLGPLQRTWVIPYGDQPWSLDPAALMSYAHSTPRVAAVIPFTWQTADGHLGIREQLVLRTLYEQAGQAILSAAKTSH